MRGARPFVAAAVFAVLTFGAVAWIKVGVWRECRAEHSFFYCLSLVGG